MAEWVQACSKNDIDEEDVMRFDRGTKSLTLTAAGKAVLVISSEHQELFGLCDRVLVMAEGRIQGTLAPDRYSEENLLTLAMTRRTRPLAEAS